MNSGAGKSRRDFIRVSAGLAGGLLAGVTKLAGKTDEAGAERPLRIVFATDSHLMIDNALRSEDGLKTCLRAIESVSPKPELIVFGGDLTDPSPALDCPEAEKLLGRFLEIWSDEIHLESHFTFGNHDLVGTKNPNVSRSDPRFGKGLFRKHLGLDRLFYGFEKGGWRFLILDDVFPNDDGTYYGEFADEQLLFLQSEFQKDPRIPTVLCGHIPSMSITPTMIGATKLEGTRLETADSLVVKNAKALLDLVGGTAANVKLVLAGHLHHQEKIEVDGLTILNGGAVCGNWWKGSVLGCPEGFSLIDLQPDGEIKIEYRTFGWQAAL